MATRKFQAARAAPFDVTGARKIEHSLTVTDEQCAEVLESSTCTCYVVIDLRSCVCIAGEVHASILAISTVIRRTDYSV